MTTLPLQTILYYRGMFQCRRYEAVIRELYGLKRHGIRPALKPTRGFLKILGNPHVKFPTFHVAGTNGKGSTTAMIASVLKEAGYATGAYYSPHISDFRERFLMNGRFFPKSKITRTLLMMSEKYEKSGLGPLTFFEWSTALAFCLFEGERVEAAVMETGLGGSFDATNVVKPEVSVITNVSLEHTSLLGNTKRAIAAEKAGIIKAGRPVVCGDGSRTVRDVVRKMAREKGSRALFLGEEFNVTNAGIFTGSGGEGLVLTPSMQGEHQLKNAALAAQAVLCAKKFRVTKSHIEDGVKKAFLPGRFEVVRKNGREIILDVAHNPEAVRALAKQLAARGGRYDFIFGVLDDKDHRTMLKILAPVVRRMYCITPDDDRAMPAEEVCSAARSEGIKAKTADAATLPLGDRTCATGSFTTVEAAIRRMNRLRE